MPKSLHSDQGTNFESAILNDVLNAFGIKKIRTSSYHPQGDGMVERSNRTILQMLSTYTLEHEDWEEGLPLVLYAYRTSRHAVTQVSPYVLMFGREAKPLPLLPTKPPYLWSPQDAITETVQRIIRAKSFAHGNIQLAQERQRRNHNRHSKDRADIQPGDEVLLYLPRRGKFTP
ncbi:hypothetical protein M514_09315 [Trichuris suis]|uniref:Integrase catalytic domain-containing protein n=1 Tax=Trichuris suis TaxID=68888 RepID=A0A085MRD9_9BILA|nr:hypothetical protein M514_09315 [Trichuris suis]